MTKEQERARARRRHETAEKAAKPEVGDSARDKQVFAVIIAVIVILAAVIAIPKLIGDRTDDTAAPAAGSSVAATAPAPSPTNANGLQAGQKLAAGCTKPPPLQAAPKQFKTVPDKATAAGKTFVATVKTNCGEIDFELDGAKAPQTVASFVSLSKAGYWAPSPCHRVTSEGIYVLQCGDPTGSGQGGPGYTFGVENAPKDGTYPEGSLAMARTTDPNSNGGQFFITYQQSKLPTDGGGYTIFGKVTKGLDIVKKIAANKATGGSPNDGTPVSPISILSVGITEKK